MAIHRVEVVLFSSRWVSAAVAAVRPLAAADSVDLAGAAEVLAAAAQARAGN